MKQKTPRVQQHMSDTPSGPREFGSDLIRHSVDPVAQLLWDSLANTFGLSLFLLDDGGNLWRISTGACIDCVSHPRYWDDPEQGRWAGYREIVSQVAHRHLAVVISSRAPQLYLISGRFCDGHALEQKQSACPSCGRIPPALSPDELRAKYQQLIMIARIVEERMADRQMAEHCHHFEGLSGRLSPIREAANTRELFERIADTVLGLPGVEAAVIREVCGRSAYRLVVRGSLPEEPMEVIQLAGLWGRSVEQGWIRALSSPIEDPGIPLATAELLRRYRAVCCPLTCGEVTKAVLFVYGRSMQTETDSVIIRLLEILRRTITLVLEMLSYENRFTMERRASNAYSELIHLGTVRMERKQLISAISDLATALWGMPALVREPHLPRSGTELDEHPLQIMSQIYGYLDLPRAALEEPGLTSLSRFCEHAAAAIMTHDLLHGTARPIAVGERSDEPAPSDAHLDIPRFPLSPREQAIVELISRGQSNKQIAQMLGCSESTVKTHVSSILRKMDARDRTEAAVQAVKERSNIRE